MSQDKIQNTLLFICINELSNYVEYEHLQEIAVVWENKRPRKKKWEQESEARNEIDKNIILNSKIESTVYKKGGYESVFVCSFK